MGRVDTEEFLCQFADLRQAFMQLLLAEVAQVQMHNLSMRSVNGFTLLFLMPERLAEAVTRPQFHRLVPW